MSESLRLSRLAEQSSVDLVCDAGSAGAGGDKSDSQDRIERKLCARRSYQAGDVILTEEAAVATNEHPRELCDWSLLPPRQGEKLLVCSRTKSVRYRGVTEQRHAWRAYFRKECEARLRRPALGGHLPIHTCCLLVARIIWSGSDLLETLAELKTHWSELRTELRLSSMKLAEHLRVYMATDSDEYLRLPSTERLAGLIAMVRVNGFSILDDLGGKIGVGIFPLCSMLNHSDTPSCTYSFVGRELQLRCVRPVKPGEELTVTYTELMQPALERADFLLEKYHFRLHKRAMPHPVLIFGLDDSSNSRSKMHVYNVPPPGYEDDTCIDARAACIVSPKGNMYRLVITGGKEIMMTSTAQAHRTFMRSWAELRTQTGQTNANDAYEHGGQQDESDVIVHVWRVGVGDDDNDDSWCTGGILTLAKLLASVKRQIEGAKREVRLKNATYVDLRVLEDARRACSATVDGGWALQRDTYPQHHFAAYVAYWLYESIKGAKQYEAAESLGFLLSDTHRLLLPRYWPTRAIILAETAKYALLNLEKYTDRHERAVKIQVILALCDESLEIVSKTQSESSDVATQVRDMRRSAMAVRIYLDASGSAR